MYDDGVLFYWFGISTEIQMVKSFLRSFNCSSIEESVRSSLLLSSTSILRFVPAETTGVWRVANDD